VRSDSLHSQRRRNGHSTARELRVPAEASELPRVRDYADSAAAAFGLDGHERYQFMFAVNEAATNAIRHGSPYEDGTIRLRLTEDGDTLSVTVCDRGPFLVSNDDSRSPGEGGRGLAMIAKLMDEFEVRIGPDATVMRLSKRRPVDGATNGHTSPS
jgi:serine/threonine-protein kinase RsbW